MSRCRNSVLSLTDGPAHSQGVVPLGDEKNHFERASMAELPDRFWEKVEKTETCWLWTASKSAKGYGWFRLNGKTWRVHRLAYLSLVGPIPEGLQLDHLCRVRNCIRPEHLEPVTCRENLMRGETLAAAQIRRTHCPRGHEYTLENTYTSSGGRSCRACCLQASREAYARKKFA